MDNKKTLMEKLELAILAMCSLIGIVGWPLLLVVALVTAIGSKLFGWPP
jgi:hypothetical protein